MPLVYEFEALCVKFYEWALQVRGEGPAPGEPDWSEFNQMW